MISCIAIDDEPLALKVIEKFCIDIPFVDLIGTFTSPIKAIPFIEEEQPQVIFLDIEMKEISGINFKKILNQETKVIFVTAYDNYAIQSYNLNAFDYLLKPVSFERFLESVSRVKNQPKPADKAPRNKQSREKISSLFVKSNKQLIQVQIEQIDYIEGLKDYVKIVVNGKQIITRESMKSIENLLSNNNFSRVHKSFIIPLEKISKIDGNRVFINDTEIPIGKTYKEDFLLLLNNTIGYR